MSCIFPSFARPARVRNAVFTRYASLSILRLVWRRLIVLSVYLALLGAFFLIGVPRANAGAGPHVIDDAGVETPGQCHVESWTTSDPDRDRQGDGGALQRAGAEAVMGGGADGPVDARALGSVTLGLTFRGAGPRWN